MWLIALRYHHLGEKQLAVADHRSVDALQYRDCPLVIPIVDDVFHNVGIGGRDFLGPERVGDPTHLAELTDRLPGGESAAQQEAQSYINQARAYALQLTAKAQGEAAAFDKVYEQFQPKAPGPPPPPSVPPSSPTNSGPQPQD